MMEELAKQEQQIDHYLEQGQKELAVKLLYGLIITYAKAKEFAIAESLRDRLIEIDSMALSEIVNSGDIIEEEKSEVIDAKQLGLWKEFYDSLTSEQGNAFYFAVKHTTLSPGQAVIKQGMLNDNLFFVNKGTLKIIYQQGEVEYYVKQVLTGETFGQDTFFSISLGTTSVVTINKVALGYLNRSDVQKLEERFPGFESKLKDFCRESGKKINDILKEKDIERRRFERFKVSGKIATQLLDKNSKAMGKPFNGHLEDVSGGGVSYFIKCSRESSARLLLGRLAEIKMLFSTDHGPEIVRTKGLIVGVRYRNFNDYTVHIKFSQNAPKDKVKKWSISVLD